MKLYEQLGENISTRISDGFYQAGDKLPSIRSMSQEHGVSISTVQEAYRLLEREGWIESRYKSGFYVVERAKSAPKVDSESQPIPRPMEVTQWTLVMDLLGAHDDPSLMSLGMGTPDVSSPTLKPLFRKISDIAKKSELTTFGYDSLNGTVELRREIARLSVNSGCRVHEDEVIVTTGCQEALACAMRVLSTPGDIVAVDSPSFYGSMQTIEALGLKVMEIPTHPETGISLDALELALEQWPIKVLLLVPTYNNPLGYSMPNDRKKKLYQLAQSYDLTIVEDDIYGDLYYQYPRPKALKSYDVDGRVFVCSSFTKTLAPGMRLGWMIPGRKSQQALQMKYFSTASTSILPQLAVAEFIASGGYERHLRKMRAQYRQNREIMIGMVERYFPEGTKVSYPNGGFLMWVEFPAGLDSVELKKLALFDKISIAPGVLFSASGKYRNCMRLNYSRKFDEKREKAIERVGQLAKQLLEKEED